MTVVLDIGGVLVKLGGMETLLRWTGLGPSALKSRWLNSETVISFETGRMPFDVFASKTIDALSLPVNADQLAAEMRAWMTEPYDGAFELIAAVRERHKLACMCNLNELRWPQVQQVLSVEAAFPRRFVSFQVGLVKPDPAFYALVAKELDTNPQEIYLFDDSKENVEAAKGCGWNAWQVLGIEALDTELKRQGLL